MRDTRLHSGFVRHDYIVTFTVADPEARRRLVERCAGEWQGDEVTETTWEISNALGPDDMEQALVELLGEGDRAAYYYLSDAKRIFRVMLR
jgi:hypothetical protein